MGTITKTKKIHIMRIKIKKKKYNKVNKILCRIKIRVCI